MPTHLSFSVILFSCSLKVLLEVIMVRIFIYGSWFIHWFADVRVVWQLVRAGRGQGSGVLLRGSSESVSWCTHFWPSLVFNHRSLWNPPPQASGWKVKPAVLERTPMQARLGTAGCRGDRKTTCCGTEGHRILSCRSLVKGIRVLQPVSECMKSEIFSPCPLRVERFPVSSLRTQARRQPDVFKIKRKCWWFLHQMCSKPPFVFEVVILITPAGFVWVCVTIQLIISVIIVLVLFYVNT